MTIPEFFNSLILNYFCVNYSTMEITSVHILFITHRVIKCLCRIDVKIKVLGNIYMLKPVKRGIESNMDTPINKIRTI